MADISKERFSNFPTSTLDSLPQDLKDKVIKIQEKTGFVPNVFLAIGHRPRQLRAFFQYYETIMEDDSSLEKTEREMIVVATSSSNKCTYCVVSHSAILRLYTKSPFLSDQIAIDHKNADISERHKTMLDFACKLARTPELIGESDHKLLNASGFDDKQIWDIGAITAFFALSNRMAHLLNLRPNTEFYNMGRT